MYTECSGKPSGVGRVKDLLSDAQLLLKYAKVNVKRKGSEQKKTMFNNNYNYFIITIKFLMTNFFFTNFLSQAGF